jgi:cell surface protein SprA
LINTDLSLRSYYVGTKKQTVFDLGWGVMEGTERVIADGKVLQRDRYYVISYDMGTLELTSPLARTADRVEIEYQREALFVPDRKLFMGMHGELKLPFLGEKSFTGMSICSRIRKFSMIYRGWSRSL